MIATYLRDGQERKALLTNPLDITITMRPNEANVSCYYAENPSAEHIRLGSWYGKVAAGGSVNYQRLSLTPHGSGTHTECFGHISAEDDATVDIWIKDFIVPAQLISVTPELIADDRVVTIKALEKAGFNKTTKALIIRTLPNADEKLLFQYTETNPPYLAPEVGEYLLKAGVEHLVVDLPSVDKEVDAGVLAVHHSYWAYPSDNARKNCSITELVYAPNEVVDGFYLLQLGIPKIAIDAVPSRLILYKELS